METVAEIKWGEKSQKYKYEENIYLSVDISFGIGSSPIEYAITSLWLLRSLLSSCSFDRPFVFFSESFL
jgi:hypothetical protein